METICASHESNWSEMFTELFNTLNGPGCFPLNDGTPCPFCEDKDKIPVVINNSLSTEIKKIPLQIICEEAGLFGSQVRDILKSKVQTDYIVEQFYVDVFGKALALKQGNYFQTMPKYSDKFVVKSMEPTAATSDATFEHPHPKVKFPPFPFVDPNIRATSQDLGDCHFHRLNWNGTTWSGWWSVDSYPRSTTSTMPWPQIDKRLFLEEKKNHTRPGEKDDSMVPGTNREVENICRVKDPYLVAVNAAIFGKDLTSPPEGSDEYYKAAQEYALFGTTQQETGNTRSTKDENEPKTSDTAKECLKQALPLHLNTRNTATSSKIKSPSPIILGDQFGIHRNVLPPPGFSNNMNQLQQTLVGLNIPQKPKVVPAQKYFQKTMNVLTPQQLIIQNAIQKHRQAGGYTMQNYPHSCPQPQPLLYPNTVVPQPYLNACFNETHINTSIIQQQQFNFYGTGPAYDMMIYAQMLQQTQTIVSKNRNAARSVPDFQKTSFPQPNLGSSSIPLRNVANQPQLVPQRYPATLDPLPGAKMDEAFDVQTSFDSESEDHDPNEKDDIRN